MAQNFILHKPTVVRSRQLGRRGQGLDHVLEALNDHFGESKVDVQDPSTKKKAAVSSPVCDVIGRIREGADIPAGRLPINLLNLINTQTSIPLFRTTTGEVYVQNSAAVRRQLMGRKRPHRKSWV